MNIEHDSYWHQEMGRLPPGDEGSTIVEVRLGGKSAGREIIETILLTLVIFLAVRGVVQNYRVEGESMVPTLADGEMLIVDNWTTFRWDDNFFARLLGQDVPPAPRYVFGHGPQRGDIVVFHAWHEDKDYIKRVIGLPGETVEVKPYDGVYINGKLLDEPYYKEVPNYTVAPLVVPTDHIFVLGDNRGNSSDSHLAYNGPVPLDQVAGRAWISYWPLNTAGLLPHPTYATVAAPAP
jgi:signal peptidase I